jgi:phosphate transport system ATP-binding protein
MTETAASLAQSQDMAEPHIEAENLNPLYGTNHALKNIFMRIPRNKITALIGPSGCGKSTFIRCLNRMNDLIPNCRIEGKVLIEGKNIYWKDVDIVELRKEVGMAFQKPNPFPMSVYDNIAHGPRIHSVKKKGLDSIVEGALHSTAFWSETSDRLKSPALFLSDGQQQRLCIARTPALKLKVILLDEPSSALDPTLKIEELLTQLKVWLKTRALPRVSLLEFRFGKTRSASLRAKGLIY